MVKMNKEAKTAWLCLAIFSLITIILVAYLVFAGHWISTSTIGNIYVINEDIGYKINITVNITDNLITANVTQVNVTFPSSFNIAYNGTDALYETFSNTTTVFSWTNASAYLIPNVTDGKKYFWFNITAATPGSYNITVQTVNATTVYQSNISVNVNDTTVPSTVSITSPQNITYWYNQSIVLNYSIVDNGVLTNCWYRIDVGGTTGTNSSGFTCGQNSSINVSATGSHTVTVFANDSGGNLNSTNVIFSTNVRPYSSSLSTQYINRTLASRFNITLTAESGSNANISLITVTFLGAASRGISFIANTNSSTATLGNPSFTNSSQQGVPVLVWNTTRSGFRWADTHNFIFNITASTAGDANVSVNITRLDGAYNFSRNLPITVNFDFIGFVQNETSANVTNANVTIYQYVAGTSGPPTETVEQSILTGSDGNFTFLSINGSAQVYTFKIIQYGPAAGCRFANTTECNATKVGPTLSPFPSTIFYPGGAMPGMPQWMTPPNLNGTTFTLQPALTLNITVYTNATGHLRNFGYEVMDINSGFPIVSSIRSNSNNYNIVIPSGREYNIMVLREPSQFSMDPTLCNYTYTARSVFNASNCPSPPKSNSTTGSLTGTAGTIIPVKFNITVVQMYLWGCLNIQGNATPINITSIYPKMLPYTGFVPPIKADSGDINLSSLTQLNYSHGSCPGQIFYNISLINSDYMIEFYGSNTSSAGSNTTSFGEFYNISLSSQPGQTNITLKGLLGAWHAGGLGEVNVSKMKINILNSSGSLYSSFNGHIEVQTSRTTNGKVRYIIETTDPTFYLPLINDTTWAKVNIFGNGPPAERKINLSATETNISLDDSTGFGFRRVLANGSSASMNVTAVPVQMRFLTNSQTCNVVTPPSSCVITTMTAENFNPFKAMLAGKVNLEMKLTTTNVTLSYINFDMFAAKPPTNSIFDESADTTGPVDLWKFGSFAPKDAYDYVVISLPYSNSSINDTRDINMSIPYLFDENMILTWNSSRGDTQANLTSDYINEKSTSFNSTGYRNFLNSGGLLCSKIDSNISNFSCYVNITSTFTYLRVPHFSTLSPTVTGYSNNVAAPATTSGGSGGSGAASASFWTASQALTTEQFTKGYTKELMTKHRVTFKIDNLEHYVGVVALTASQATINVSSSPQQAVFNIGDEKKFEVTNDTYYDISVKLNNIISSKANVTIKSIHEAISKCGDGKVDAGETCSSCSADVKCAANEECKNDVCTAKPVSTIEKIIEKIIPTGEVSLLKSTWFWTIIALIVIVAAVLAYVIYRKTKY